MKYPKSKHATIRRLALTGILFGLAGFTTVQAESIAQSEIRAQASRFWKVAEDRVVLVPAGESEQAWAKPSPPVHSLATGLLSPPPPLPPPTVRVRQSVDHAATAGHFGFSLFGGLRLFDFDWGETRQHEHDSLDGRL